MDISSARDSDGALSALDFALIRQLLPKSSQALDSGDATGWVSCFCPDGQFELAGGTAGDARIYSGRDELRRYVGQTVPADKAGATRRWLAMPNIEGGGDRATFRTYEMHYAPMTGDGCLAIASGIVDCEVRKIGGDWLYSKFRLTIEDFEHGEWMTSAMAGLEGSGCHTPHVEIWRGQGEIQGDEALDHELILRTLAAFLLYMDDGSESERLAALFTEGGCWHLSGVNGLYRSGAWHGKAMEPVYRGRAAIRAFNQAAHAKRRPWDRHWGHAPLIRIDGDHATAIFPYTTILAGIGPHVRPMIAGVYHDRLRKVGGHWLIEDCAVFIERTPADLTALVEAASGQYVGGVD